MSVQRQIELPEELCAAAEKQFGAQFESLQALIEFVLRELTRDDAAILEGKEQRALEERLRNLGYM